MSLGCRLQVRSRRPACQLPLVFHHSLRARTPRARGRARPGLDDGGLSAFLRVRPRLFGIAYRMLGSAAEAEDIVQDVWVHWQTADRSLVRDAAAFLVTTAARLAINVLQSARSRRETYVGPWLPEPVDTSADAGSGAERGEALELGSWYCWRSCHPRNVLRSSFERRSTMHIVTSRTSFGLKRPRLGKWDRARQHVTKGRRMPANSAEQQTSARRVHRSGPKRRRRPASKVVFARGRAFPLRA